MQFIFTKHAEKQLHKLPQKNQKLIIEKLKILKWDKHFQLSIKVVHDLEPATHRIRVGNYRLLIKCNFKDSTSIVLKVGHRRDVYR